ncbi:MAG: hypothetical protein KGV44_11835 [Flavobacteriaceae bacterium]|nr:hypothetical protein [Flavobacteriaceae bacterium]
MKNENKIQKSSQDFIQQIKSIISTAQQNVVKSVNHERVLMYWKIGERIVVEEQNGKERADYYGSIFYQKEYFFLTLQTYQVCKNFEVYIKRKICKKHSNYEQ